MKMGRGDGLAALRTEAHILAKLFCESRARDLWHRPQAMAALTDQKNTSSVLVDDRAFQRQSATGLDR
jgi:hypothetical protein